jgi:hypothetical protein
MRIRILCDNTRNYVKRGFSDKFRENNQDFYRSWDRLVLRDIDYKEEDLRRLTPHPQEAYNKYFIQMNNKDYLLPQRKLAQMDRDEKGVSEHDVLVDVDTFLFRDVFKRHLKNIREPIPENDYFLLMATYFILGYFAWIGCKALGKFIRSRDQKVVNLTPEELLRDKKRLEEDKQNAEMVLQAKAPQLYHRFQEKEEARLIGYRAESLKKRLRDENVEIPPPLAHPN